MQQWRLIIIGFVALCSACNTHTDREAAAKPLQSGTPEVMPLQTADTASINKLFIDANPLIYTHTDSAISLYLRAFRLSKVIDYFEGVACAYMNLVLCYKNKNEFAKANTCYTDGIAYLEKALHKTWLLHQPKIARKLYPYLLRFYSDLNNYAEVIRNYQVAREYYDQNDSVQRMQIMHMKIPVAGAYFSLEQYDSASAIYLSILSERKTPDKENYALLGYSYLGLGCIEVQMELKDKALAYLSQAVKIAKQFGDTALHLRALQGIGGFYYNHQDLKKAKKYAQEAIAIAKKSSNPVIQLPALFNSTYNIATVLMREEKVGEALIYSKMAQKYANQTQDKSNQLLVDNLIGTSYIRLNQPHKAIKYLSATLQTALELQESVVIINLYGQLSEAYAAAGNYKSAFELKSRYAKLMDSVRGQESAKRIAEVNAKYRVSQKDKALAQQQLLIERQQKVQYLWIGGALFLIGILLALLWRKQHKVAMEKLRARLAGEEQERSRMARELHDGIVSRLSVIKTNFSALPQYYRGDSEAEELQEAIRQLDQGIAELRNTSHNLMPEMLKRNGLTATIERYCEDISKTGVLQVVFQVIGHLPALKDSFQLNIYRIIQELLQNIIKHSGACRALIQFNIRGDQLQITVDDNGNETRPEAFPPQQGIGLQNLKDRVRLLGGDMEIETGNGTSVYLRFDMKKHKDLI